MIKRLLTAGTLTATLVLGVGLPATTASATGNPTKLAQCERTAAQKYQRHVNQNNQAQAKRQFNKDIAKCKRRFG